MARSGERDDDAEEPAGRRIERGVLRSLTHGVVVLLSLAVLGGWLSTGFYQLALGEEAIILRLGEHHRTVRREGLNWHWPEPIEYDHPVNVSGVRTEFFGRAGQEVDGRAGQEADGRAGQEADGRAGQRAESDEERSGSDGLFIQTADKNIVSLSFDLQYTIEDPYAFTFAMANPRSILYEATKASMRKVVGGMTVDEVLTQRKAEIEVEARRVLIETLAQYAESSGSPPAFAIDKLNLQDVQPPQAVREAFQEVSSAGQDEERSASRARGDAQEILERARAEAAELREGSEAYKDAKIQQARGEAARFVALHDEYARAPEVTRTRLYLETLEAVLPDVETMIVEPNTVGVMPLLQAGPRATPRPAPAPVSAAPAEGRR